MLDWAKIGWPDLTLIHLSRCIKLDWAQVRSMYQMSVHAWSSASHAPDTGVALFLDPNSDQAIFSPLTHLLLNEQHSLHIYHQTPLEPPNPSSGPTNPLLHGSASLLPSNSTNPSPYSNLLHHIPAIALSTDKCLHQQNLIYNHMAYFSSGLK